MASPYERIVADIQQRITTGRLRSGDRVPSTRAIVRDWGVAMATATKALTVLRQGGWIETVPGSGSVVADHPRAAGPRTDARPALLSRDRLVAAAVRLADAEGRSALSMRRIAAELGVGPMSLYRHVPDKEELLRLMADAVFGAEELPESAPDHWRTRLEIGARVQWRAYRRHPWLAPILLNSLERPPVIPAGLTHVDWSLRALAGTPLDQRTRLRVVVMLHGHIGGLAATRAFEVESELDTGMTGDQRLAADSELLEALLATGNFPGIAAGAFDTGEPDLDDIFELGLRVQLDGIAALIESVGQGRR